MRTDSKQPDAETIIRNHPKPQSVTPKNPTSGSPVTPASVKNGDIRNPVGSGRTRNGDIRNPVQSSRKK